MKKVLSLLAWRWLTPLVLALFLLGYILAAMFTDEALVTLIGLVSRTVPLQAILAVAPLNLAARLVREALNYRRRSRLLLTGIGREPEELFDENQLIAVAEGHEGAAGWLASVGYRVRRGEGWLSAVKGVSLLPARLLWLAGIFLLFAGVLLSLAGRVSMRLPVIEGEPFPPELRVEGMVRGIELTELKGATLLARTLAIRTVLQRGGAADERIFGLYPPGRVGGAFLYPRYLGVAPRIELAAPDLPQTVSDFFLLQIYPPGREDVAEFGGTPYRAHFRLVESHGEDPYVTGRFVFHCRIERGGSVIAQGEVPLGGVLSAGGVRLAVPEARRFVVTDFVRDSGVLLIWTSMFLLPASALLALAICLVGARRELLVMANHDGQRVFSRSEGRRREHDGVFHETLDLFSRDVGQV